MRAVDTNVLVRLLTRDDAKQVAAAEEFVEAGGAWVSLVVLVEAIWVLSTVYDVGSKPMADAIEMLLDHQSLVVQNSDVVAIAVANYRRRPSVGLSDHLVLEIARQAGNTPLGTFDRGLAKMDGAQRL